MPKPIGPLSPKPATKKQTDYLAILLNDCGVDTAKKRVAFFQKRHIEVRALDELRHDQAQHLISELVDTRDQHREIKKKREEDQDDNWLDGFDEDPYFYGSDD